MLRFRFNYFFKECGCIWGQGAWECCLCVVQIFK